MSDKKLWRISELEKLKEIRQFSGGKHSSKVVLLEQNVVAKHHTAKQKRYFERELQILTRLVGCSFVPQLLASSVSADTGECVLYMTYCGEQVSVFDAVIKTRVGILVKELSKRWRVGRGLFASKLPKRHNVTLLDGSLKLIDFNSGQWKLKSPSKVPTVLPPTNGGESI